MPDSMDDEIRENVERLKKCNGPICSDPVLKEKLENGGILIGRVVRKRGLSRAEVSTAARVLILFGVALAIAAEIPPLKSRRIR